MLSVGLKIEGQGIPADYVEANIKWNNYGSTLLLQPVLIKSILNEVGLGPRTTLKTVPVWSQKNLQPHPDSKVFDNHFHYWSIIGKLNFLTMLMHHDIQFAVHSCARYRFASSRSMEKLKGVHLKLACYSILRKIKHLRYMPMLTLLVIGLRSVQNLSLLWLHTGQAG